MSIQIVALLNYRKILAELLIKKEGQWRNYYDKNNNIIDSINGTNYESK